MMLSTGRLVVPPDSLTVLAKDLPLHERTVLGSEYDEEGAMLGRRISRAPAVFVTKSVLELFEEFRSPTVVAVAIARYAARTNQSAERVLDDSFQALLRLRAIGLLIPEGEIETSAPIYFVGDSIARWRMRQCLQSYDDCDVYVAEGNGAEPVVCKVARQPHDARLRRRLRREAATLRLLGSVGISVPTLVALTNDGRGRPLLVMSYVAGRRIDHRAHALRQTAMAQLVAACGKAIGLLALIHRRGLLHGDVHGGNYLLTDDGNIVAIDFSEASLTEKPCVRHGVPKLMDPQWARARLAGENSPLNSPEAEQYSMAALVYFLLTGEHHYGAVATVEELCAALAEGKLSDRLRRQSNSSDSGVLAVLARALDTEPIQRWPNLDEFSSAFDAAAATFDSGQAKGRMIRQHQPRNRFAEFLSPLLLAASATSLASGTAGTATALLVGSTLMQDPSLLAWADFWSEESLTDSDCALPKTPRARKARREDVGTGGIWHGRLGVLSTRLAISHALDDRQTREAAVDAYLRDHNAFLRGSAPADLTHGLASCLLMDAHLLASIGDTGNLRSAGVQGSRALTGRMKSPPKHPGLAHGTSGHMLALLAWHAASKEPLPNMALIGDFLNRISKDVRGAVQGRLLTCREAWCRPNWEASWCNGATGAALLFLAAADVLSEAEYVNDAEAAVRVALAAEPQGYDLCCGVAGRLYALRRLWAATGENVWRRHAAKDARQLEYGLPALSPHGLTKGRAGALAVTDDVWNDRFVLPLVDTPLPARQHPAVVGGADTGPTEFVKIGETSGC